MGEPFRVEIAAQREQIIAQMKQAIGTSTAELEPDWADRLLTAFISEVQGESIDAFLAALEEMLRSSIRLGDSLERWWWVLFALRRQTLPYLATIEALAQAEKLWQQAQLLIQDMAERFSSYQQLVAEKRDQILREMGQKLITAFDLGQLVEMMAQELPNLGIKSCYLALYESLPRSWTPPRLGLHEERRRIRRSGLGRSWFMRTRGRLN